MRRLLYILLMAPTAFAASPTPEQSAWLNTLFQNLYQGAPSAQAEQAWTFVVVEGLLDIDTNAPVGFGASSPQMSEESCNALAAAVTSKADQCGSLWDSLQSCIATATSGGSDPTITCQAVQSLVNDGHTALVAMATDWNKYCYED